MVVHSAGLLPVREAGGSPEVFVAHMGGPFWARKDEGAWSIVKGEFDPSTEQPEVAARREFAEETGVAVDDGLLPLGEFRVTAGKVLHVFVCRTERPVDFVASNTFELEWPPRSGRIQSFPEVDRAGWLDLASARSRLVKGQRPVLDALVAAWPLPPSGRDAMSPVSPKNVPGGV